MWSMNLFMKRMPRPFRFSRFSGARGLRTLSGLNPAPSSSTRITSSPCSTIRSTWTCLAGFCWLPCLIALASASRMASSTECCVSLSIPNCSIRSFNTTWTSSMFSNRLPMAR